MSPHGAINPRLALLLAGGVAATLIGVNVVVFVPRADVPNAMLVDAGIKVDCTARWLSCWVCSPVCAPLACCQQRIPLAVAKTLPSDGGDREVIAHGKAEVREFRRLVAQFGEASACRATNATWAEVANFDQDPSDEEPSCRCQRAAGPPCLFTDGGAITVEARTAMPGEFVPGAGCIPRLCGGPAGSDPIPSACLEVSP